MSKAKELERYWKNSRHQQRNPAGYTAYKESLKEKPSDEESNSSTKKGKSKSKSKSKSKKWKLDGSEEKSYLETIKDTEAATKRLKDYKPQEMDVGRNKYTNDLPPRPGIPKLPKLTTPGGNLKISKVAKPSGLKGTIKTYDSKPDYSKVYTNLKPSKKNKSKSQSSFNIPKPTFGKLGVPSTSEGGPTKSKPKPSFNLPKPRIGKLGVPSTKKAPGVTGGVRPVPKKPFGKGTSNYATGVSTGPAPKKKKKNSSPFSSKK